VAYREEPQNSLLAEELAYTPYIGDRQRRRASGRGYTPEGNMYIPNTTWTWAFMVVTIVQAAVVLGLES
jgi:hypothetical protein